MMGDSDSRSVLLVSSLFRNLILVAVTAENPAHKDRVLEMEVGFSALGGHLRILRLDSDPERVES